MRATIFPRALAAKGVGSHIRFRGPARKRTGNELARGLDGMAGPPAASREGRRPSRPVKVSHYPETGGVSVAKRAGNQAPANRVSWTQDTGAPFFGPTESHVRRSGHHLRQRRRRRRGLL